MSVNERLRLNQLHTNMWSTGDMLYEGSDWLSNTLNIVYHYGDILLSLVIIFLRNIAYRKFAYIYIHNK